MDTYGKHFIAEFWEVESKKLNNLKDIKKNMELAVKKSKGTALNIFGHKFSPQGVSVVITISESHLSIHTFPEHNYCAIDIYTCGNTFPKKAVDHLKAYFKPKKTKYDDLLTKGLIEYIDADEEDNLYVATNKKQIRVISYPSKPTTRNYFIKQL